MDVVLLDTNVLISAFINPKGSPAKLLKYWKSGEFNIAISDVLFEEFKEVIRRPRIKDKYRIAEEEIKEVEEAILEKAIFVPLAGMVKICRDPNDNAVLETAILANADYLITGDKDIKTPGLVTHLEEHGVKIIPVSKYVLQLGS